MYQGGVKSTVSWVFEDLKFKISEGSDQNRSCPGSALLAVWASRDISLKPPYSKESSGHNFKNKAIEATLELVKKIKQSSFIVLGQTDKLKILPRDGTGHGTTF